MSVCDLEPILFILRILLILFTNCELFWSPWFVVNEKKATHLYSFWGF